LYDVESFLSLKIILSFTKNRSSKFDGTTSLYKVPNRAGFHQAKLLGEFKTEVALKIMLLLVQQ
jgi:hypothetical protein